LEFIKFGKKTMEAIQKKFEVELAYYQKAQTGFCFEF
jgi:hypothetical protein